MDLVNDEQKKQIKSIVDKTVAKFIEDLPELLRKNLERQVAAMLGFECDSWGKWKVDAYDRNRSPVANLISDRIRAVVTELVKNQEWAPKKEHVQAVAEAFEHKFKYEVEDQIRRLAERKAAEFADQLNKDLTLEIIARPSVKDVSNPGFMAEMPKIRDVIYESLAKGEIKPTTKK